MKSNPKSARPAALAAATLALSATSAFAQTLLLSDNFDTAGDAYGGFNDAGNLTADQSGTAATKTYLVDSGLGWPGAFQRGNGGTFLMFAGVGNFGSTNMHGCLNYDIAAAANTLNSPLEIKFNMTVTAGVDPSEWTSFTVSSGQNPFVNDVSVGFSSLFRDGGGTQQFSNGADLGAAPYSNPGPSFTDGQLITFVISNAAGTGSAFNSDGATDVVKMYVNGSLTNTFTGLDLDATDQYVSFHASNTVANIDNLAITALTIATDYDTWSGPSGFNLSGGQAADDDNDGLTNHEEYAFGLIPTSGASVNPISTQLDKSAGTFSYTRRKPSFGTNLTYSVWFSENLADWTKDTGATEGTLVPSGDNETVPVTLSTLPGNPLPAKLFIQVRAN
jgi:hypothetical protein